MGAVDAQVRLELQKEFDEIQKVQKEIQKSAELQKKLDSQLNQNTVVKDELEFLEPESNVYKLTGPVLVKQDLGEAKGTVSKRIEYISAEIKRQETLVADLEKQLNKHKESVSKIQAKATAVAH
nr:prefoldin subunit 6-like [Ciona intestinalis]|eukprot:XP_002128134.1 prefoldin subunit 6-like [Ciona intestinalis]